MPHHERHGTDHDLVEDQGVNAGPPIDEDVDARPDEAGASVGGPPDPLDLLNSEPAERVGLPEQRPGYPGQQRSIDTS